MKVVKEGAKEQRAVASLPRRTMRNPVSNGVTRGPQVDALEVKSFTNDPSVGEKLSTSRVQQSMRRSKFSGELERDMAFPAPQPPARLATTTTPLNPVTPLRWKSSKRLELEKKKLQEELKAKEEAKEEKKNPKPAAKDEKKEQQSKSMTAMPKPQANAMDQVSHKANKDSRFATSASISGSMVLPQTNAEVTTDTKHSPSVTNGGSAESSTPSEEASPLDGIDRSNGEVSGTDRKALPGDESPVITIDFLRARLLAERASSKAAKELVQQVTKKVLELEGRLDQEIQARKKAEEAAQGALSKFEILEKTRKLSSKESPEILGSGTGVAEKLWGPNQVSETETSEPLSPHEKRKTEQQGQVLEPNQGEQKCPVDDSSPYATTVTNPDHTLPIPLDVKDGRNQVKSEVKVTSVSSGQENGDHQGVQSFEKIGSQEVKQDPNPTFPRAVSTSRDSMSSANPGLQNQQERRSAVEERLRHMWDEMREEMAALVDDKTHEELGREELLNWMGHVPSVLQDILPKPSEDKKLVITFGRKHVQLKDGGVPPASLNFDQALKEGTKEGLSLNGAQSGDKRRTHAQGVKKVASLIERFEAQETNQREWEQSNAKQNLTGRRRSNESSITRATSNSGTPEHPVASQQECHQEELDDVAPKHLSQVEELRCYSNATSSSLSPHPCRSTESLLTKLENGKMDTQTPETRIPSTGGDPPTVEGIVDRSGEERGATQRTDDSILKDADLQSERSLTPFRTPLPQGTPSGPSALENEGHTRRSREDRSQVVLRQSNHHLNPRALEVSYEALEGHSGRSNIEREQPSRSRTVAAGWVNLEDAETYGMPADKGDNALRWDASYVGLHLQQENLASYSQAGNSNAYVRPGVPGSYPLRNDEREIYRGRMESVSRSMEGLGGSWRSVSDHEGDEAPPYADMAVSNESAFRRPGHQMVQGNESSGRSNCYQAESVVGSSQNFAYPGREFPRDAFQSRPSTKLESSASKVNEVLKALQLAKLSIQKTGGRRTSISNTLYSTSEHSYSGGEKQNLKTDSGVYGGDGMSNRSPVAIRVWSHEELSRRYSTGSFREPGSPPRLQQSTSSAQHARGKDHQEDHPLAGRSSPVSHARRKFVDKLSTGRDVRYVYPT